MDKNGLSSFLLGLGVGVGIGMLFAPKSGQETREMIKNKAGEGTDYLKQRSADIKQSAGEWVDKGKQSAGEWVDKGKQSASEWVDKGKEAIGRQKDNIADAVEAGRQAYRDTVNSPQS
jgi:gas vesicle protein